MALNLPLLYFVWTEDYCQTSPNKNKIPNLWHVTSILVCCVFGPSHRFSSFGLERWLHVILPQSFPLFRAQLTRLANERHWDAYISKSISIISLLRGKSDWICEIFFKVCICSKYFAIETWPTTLFGHFLQPNYWWSFKLFCFVDLNWVDFDLNQNVFY